MSSTRGLVTYAVLHHVLAAAAILSLGADDKFYSNLLGLAAFAFLTVIVRRGWQVAESPDMSPGRAQGFLFIPFFNYYWVFRSFAGLPAALTSRGDKFGVAGAKFGSGFALTCAILLCISHIAWLANVGNFLEGLLYTVYAGFAVVLVWQVISSIRSLDQKASESQTMSPVAVSAIVLGPLVATFAAIPLVERLIESHQTAEVAMAGVASKGFDCRLGPHESNKFKEIGVVVSKIQVYAPGNRLLGQVFYVDAASLTVAQRRELDRIFGHSGERSGPNYYYRATRIDTDQENMKFKDWVASF